MSKNNLKRFTVLTSIATIGLLALVVSEAAHEPLDKEPLPTATDSKGITTQYLAKSLPRTEKDSLITSFDDIIEPGFPVQTYHGPGQYRSGQAINTVVEDINADAYPDIVVTGMATGPLYAFDYQGNTLPGWPVHTTNYGLNYASIYDETVFVGTWEGDEAAFAGDGTKLWENTGANYIAAPPSVDYIDTFNSGTMFIEEEDWYLHAYDVSNGNSQSGWPFYGDNGQEMQTPAIVDLDNDGAKTIISASQLVSSGITIYGIRETGVEEWRLHFPKAGVVTFPVVGDVDGDGSLEVVIMSKLNAYPWTHIVNVVDSAGNIERSWSLIGGSEYGTAPALADINQDGTPEILVQTSIPNGNGYLEVYDGLGNVMPGFPVNLGYRHSIANSAPVVGDVDGDLLPEIVLTSKVIYDGYIHVINNDGTYVDTFPRFLRRHDSGAVPAIADIDLDCHNEIIINSAYWGGTSGYFDKVWVFDLSRLDPKIEEGGIFPHGKVEWGQFMSNAQHTGVYKPNRPICIHEPEEFTW